ncbi:AEC family transporter [Methyloparacoccus murrellii]|jgi:predicted permease
MVQVLMQMGLLILFGAVWRTLRPGGLDAGTTRHVLTTLVFNLLLPALVLTVLWDARLGLDSVKLSLYGAAIVFIGAGVAWLMGRAGRIQRHRLGAAMLGIAFANITYMGLPLLEHLYGPRARAIVVHLDVFAGMPLVLTFGLLIARQHGTPPRGEGSLLRPLLVNPPIWAGIAALALNLSGIRQPAGLQHFLEPLADAVAPLMLIAVGLSLQWQAWRRANLPLGLAVMVAKMIVMPLLGLGLAWLLGFRGETLTALVLEAGMPCMLFGVVYCDRYRLDSGFYAMTVLLTALSATLTLPFWHRWVGSLPA